MFQRNGQSKGILQSVEGSSQAAEGSQWGLAGWESLKGATQQQVDEKCDQQAEYLTGL